MLESEVGLQVSGADLLGVHTVDSLEGQLPHPVATGCVSADEVGPVSALFVGALLLGTPQVAAVVPHYLCEVQTVKLLWDRKKEKMECEAKKCEEF